MDGGYHEAITLASRDGRSCQDRWTDRAWTVSWMSMNRIDQYPARGSGSSSRAQENPVNVTADTEADEFEAAGTSSHSGRR